MQKVIIGSTNPVKLGSVQEAFATVFGSDGKFDFITYAALSGVSDQPMNQEETKQGAENRAAACLREYPDASYGVGLEGGLEQMAGKYWVMAWMCVMSNEGGKGFGRTATFQLPPAVGRLIDEGYELGTANDMVFGETNSKKKGGAVGLITDNKLTRQSVYRDAMIFALAPFAKPELFAQG